MRIYTWRITLDIQNRKSRRRNGQTTLRFVFALGTATACVLAYLLSDVSRVEAIVLPGIVIGLVLFGIAVLRPHSQPPGVVGGMGGLRPQRRFP